MKLRIRYLLVVLVLTAACSAEVLACSCAGDPPPCQAFWRTDAVFAGTVVSSGKISVDDGGFKHDQRLVHLTVDQPFRGMQTAEVDVVTGWGGGDCGFGFKIGERYLVYAHRDQKGQRLGTSICTRTRPLSEAGDDLAFIRSMPTSSANGLVLGIVGKRNHEWKEGEKWYKPVANAELTIEGDGRQYQAQSDSDGNFRVDDVVPGKYVIKLKLPPGLIRNSLQKDEGASIVENEIEVAAHGCAETGFYLESDTRVRGRVLDVKGNPVARMQLNMRGAPSDKTNINTFLYTVSDADGYFEFKTVAPGDYWLGYHLLNSALQEGLPYGRTYLPGVPTKALAAIVTVKEGEKVSGLTLQLPPPLQQRTVNGVVVSTDGQPVKGASVYVSLSEEGEMSSFFSVATDENGRFTLKVFEGMQYKVSAYKESGALRAQSNYIEIPLNLGEEALKLELPPLRPLDKK